MKKLTKTLLLGAFSLAMAANADAANAKWQYVAASDGSTYGISQDGTLWGWGWNESGQLGQGYADPDRSSAPLQLGEDNDWASVFGGKAFAFAIKKDGTLWHVGAAEKGASGVGDGVSHKTLTQVGTDANWSTVAASHYFGYSVFAIKTDGTLWAWGNGYLGNNKYGTQSTPVQLGTDTDWAKVSAGDGHTLAIKTDGSLWMWGWEQEDCLCEQGNLKVPTRYGEATDWADVFAVDKASYAIKTDGTLWAWGTNTSGILGTADATSSTITTPTQVPVDGKVVFIAGSRTERIVGIGENGVATKLIAWGSNANGALGDGNGSAFDPDNEAYTTTPVTVKLKEGIKVTQLSCGERFSVVLADNGLIYGWGSNVAGQLGNYCESSQMTFKAEPIQMATQEEEVEGVYEFDANSIPGSLSDAKKIILTGEWGTSDFLKISVALGNNSGWPPVGNTTLEVVDMSQITVKESSQLYGTIGMSNYGVFNGCKGIKHVIMPAAAEAAKFTSLRGAFQNNILLEDIDLTGCTGLTDLTDTFYGCASLKEVDLSACSKVTNTESTFDNCTSLVTVKLPSAIKWTKYIFGSCESLKTIDWSLYAEETAPTANSTTFYNYFQYIDDLSAITLIVPEAAYNSFAESNLWSKLNLQKSTTGVSTIVNDSVVKIKGVYDINGRYYGASTEDLTPGLYIINGKKVLVK